MEMGRAGLETLVLRGGRGHQEDQEDVWAAGRSELQRGQLWPQRAQKALLLDVRCPQTLDELGLGVARRNQPCPGPQAAADPAPPVCGRDLGCETG